MEPSLPLLAGVCCQASEYRGTSVTPGNPLWFLDLVSLLSQPAPKSRREKQIIRVRKRRRRSTESVLEHEPTVSEKHFRDVGLLMMLASSLLLLSLFVPPRMEQDRPYHYERGQDIHYSDGRSVHTIPTWKRVDDREGKGD